MKIQVVGVGQRRSGVSKSTGKEYDGQTIYGIKLDRDVTGHATKEIYLNFTARDFPVITVGDMLDIDYTDRGFIEDITVLDDEKITEPF